MPLPRMSVCALIALSLLACSRPAHGEAEDSKVFRFTDTNVAWQAAQISGRPILLFVSMNRCHFCDKMILDTYSQPAIADEIERSFESVLVMRETDPRLVRQLCVRTFPTTLVVSPDGALITRIDGYADPVRFAAELQHAVAMNDNLQQTATVSQLVPADPPVQQ